MSEQYSRYLIDKQLEYSNWDPSDQKQVRFELSGDGTRADYVLFDKNGPLCVIEAKNPDKDPYDAKEQAKKYAEELKAPFIILSNGVTHWFWNLLRIDEEDAKQIERFPSQEDLHKLKLKNFTPPFPLSSEKITDNYLQSYNSDIFLRKYQINALDELSRQFDNENKRKFLLEMATGTGKTLLCAALILRFLKTRNAQRVLFIVDRIELAKQTMEDFNLILRDYQPVIYKNARKRPAELWGSSVVVATIQSLMVDKRFRKEFTPFHFDLIVNDEAHRSIYGDSREAVQFFQGTRVGLTATPKAYLKNIDQIQLAQDKPKVLEARELKDTYNFFGCKPGEPTFRYDLIDAAKDPDGPYLCTPTIFNIRSDVTTQALDDSGWSVTVNEQEETYKIKDLEKKILIPERNRLMCENLFEKAQKEPNGDMGKTIVFCVSQNHATAITKLLNEIKPNSAVTITSRLGAEASTIAKDFRDGKRKERIAVSVDMLSTGYNCRDLLNIALFRPIFSPTEYIQIKGRGTRLHEFIYKDKKWDKPTFYLLDYCGVVSYFEEDYDYDVPLSISINDQIKTHTNPSTSPEIDIDGQDPVIITDIDPVIITEGKSIPVWTGVDIIVSQEDYIVGPEGEKVDIMTYRGRFEKQLHEYIESSPEIQQAIDEEDDDRIEDNLSENFLFRPTEYFAIDKLNKAYDIPLTLSSYVYSIYGKKPLPTKKELSRDTVSSLSSIYSLSYEQERWLETTVELIIDDSEVLDSFMNNDLASIFSAPQFTVLGGIATLRNFDNRDEVFNSLKNSALIRQANLKKAA